LGAGTCGLAGLAAGAGLAPRPAIAAPGTAASTTNTALILAEIALLQLAVTELLQRTQEGNRERPGSLATRVHQFYASIFFPQYLSILSLALGLFPTNRPERLVLAPIIANLPIFEDLSRRQALIQSRNARVRRQMDQDARDHDLGRLASVIGSDLEAIDEAYEEGLFPGLAVWLLLLLTMIALDNPGLGLATYKMLLALQMTFGRSDLA
jgi:hypothetical protein